jgi:flagellar M-ring protein FliF
VTEDDVHKITKAWTDLDMRRRLVVVLAAVAVLVSVLGLARMVATPSMKLLYAGLEIGAAGDVVQALEQRGITYEVRGGSIYVVDAARDELRMTLASEGLPSNGGRGYELLDSLTGFGTTSQMFDAAYWRAKEGELARTIVASRYIAQARVHIAHDGSSPFRRSAQPTASVSVTPFGAPVTGDQANAIRHLVASAVAGLAAENVTVVDANGSLVGPAEAAVAAIGGTDRAELLRERVLRLVEARVGTGNAFVEVSVDTVTETRSIRERRIDPDSRVAVSTDVEERTDSSTDRPGTVTVASNLPDGDAAGGEGSKAATSATRERINYEVSETETEIRRTPGAIRRLTVAVLVNGMPETAADGSVVMIPRPAGELEALHELVAATVGFDAERGDVITLKSMDLPSVDLPGTMVGPSWSDRMDLDPMTLIQIAALMLVTLGLGLFVVRPILNRPAAPMGAARALPPVAVDLPALTGEIAEDDEPRTARTARSTVAGLPATAGGASAVERLRTMIGERQDETVEILRSWLEEGEGTAG